MFPREVKGTKKDGISALLPPEDLKHISYSVVNVRGKTTAMSTSLPECDGMILRVYFSFGIEERSRIQHDGPTSKLV